VPTTAGTGTEVTRNAVLGSPQHGVKASLRSPLLLPKVAIVDPRLTIPLPPEITARTGLDTLTQLIEPYVSIRANPLTDCFCREGLRLVARSLSRAYTNGQDIDARTDMSLASLYGGLSLANAGLGVVHGFAAPIGGMFDAPHGAVCAALLPYGMMGNLEALQTRAALSETLQRYDEIARILTGRSDAKANDGVLWVQELVQHCAIPTLRQYGIKQEHVRDLVGNAERASSMKANPITLTSAELTKILEAAL
jgi:alcohol dehydrogenase class IV